MFGQKNISGKLKLLASIKCPQLESRRVSDLVIENNEVRITALTVKKLRLEERLAVCMRSHVWRRQLPVAVSGCRK